VAPRPVSEVAPAPALSAPFALSDHTIPGFPDLRAETSQHVKLHTVDPSRVQLPTVSLPASLLQVGDEYTLSHAEVPNPKGAKRHLKVLRAPLPFPVAADEQTFRPAGMIVRIDGEVVPFAQGPAPQARRPTWRITGRNMVLSYPEIPEQGAIQVLYAGVRDTLDRHDPAVAGLSDTDFLRTEISIGRDTRSGLLLIAPTTAEWDLTLPTGSATFETHLAMESAPVARPRSDGATVQLSVVDNGKETVVDTQTVPGAGRAGFAPWRVDLSTWAGRDVTVRLHTDPGQTSVFDWVVAAEPAIWGPPGGDVRRVIVVALDTTRPDHLSFFGYERPTTPEIDAFAASGAVLERTWSTAPRTRPSFRSATTGRRPLEAVGAKNIGAVFSEHGFATAGIVANPHLQPRFDFHRGFDRWQFDPRANAEDQVDRSLAWLEEHRDRDAYLFVHFMDPHMIYDAPGAFRERFVTDPDPDLPDRVKRSDVMGWSRRGTISDQRRAHLEALHDGELAYTSGELGRLFDAIDRMPGRSLVVLHSDHGEEFWDHGGFEHNHTLYDELTRAVLVFRPRGGLPDGVRIPLPASLVDIGPTLYDLFGFADAPQTDGRSLVPVLAGAEIPWADRPLPVAHLQYSHERWAVVWNGHKYILHTGSGREELYDLAADAGEQEDQSTRRDLAPFRVRLGEAHGIPVGPGWRVRVSLDADAEPLVIELPAPAILAGVLDPETIVEHRANVEWGDLPDKLPADVGTVILDSAGTKLTFTPGPVGEGMLYVLFDSVEHAAPVVLPLGGAPRTGKTGKRGTQYEHGDYSVQIEPGTVVVPPPTEAARMGIGPGAAGAKDEMAHLCELGYVDCSDAEQD